MFKINPNPPTSALSYVHSDIIRPISINDPTSGNGSATFIFRNIGTLDHNTSIRLPIILSDEHKFLPLNVGILSVIKSAVLKSGGDIICQNHDVAVSANIFNSSKSVSFKRNVLSANHGYIATFQPSEAGVLNTANPLGKISMNLGNGAYTEASPMLEASGKQGDSEEYANYIATNDASTTLQAVISLKDLFPYAGEVLNLPLNLIKDEISLVLHFSRNGADSLTNDRVCSFATQTAGAYTATVDTANVECLVDYLIFKDESEDAAEIYGPKGKVIHYSDINFNTYNMDGLAATASIRNRKTYDFSLSATNQSIRQMYLQFCPAAAAAVQRDSGSGNDNQHFNTDSVLFGKYSSFCPSQLQDGMRFQMFINQRQLFQEPLQNYAQYITEYENAIDSKLQIPQSLYSFIDGSNTEGDVGNLGEDNFSKSLVSNIAQAQGWFQASALVGSNFIVGVDLEKKVLYPDGKYRRVMVPGSGTRINEAPIKLKLETLCRKDKNNDKRLLKVMSVVEKNLIIKSGQIMILDA